MAALPPQPDPDLPATSPDAVVPVRDNSPARTAASDRDGLLRDLVRALARSAAREAWALACPDHPDSQETSS
jgi:hypothetical protein